MSREVRRVPLDYEPPRRPCTFTHLPQYETRPCPGWHHQPQFDQSYRDALEEYLRGKAEWEAGTHEHLEFCAVYHREGGGKWRDRHLEGRPYTVYAEDGNAVLREVWFRTVEQFVREVPWTKSSPGGPRPRKHDAYRPDWPADAVLGYCYYETVSEGTPLSPIFATPAELAAWLVKNEGMSAEGAARFVEAGWVPSGISSAETGFLTGMQAIDRGAL